jgi:hypothetical protein
MEFRERRASVSASAYCKPAWFCDMIQSPTLLNQLLEAISGLPERERTIIEARHCIPTKRLEVLAKEFSVSKERISQLQTRAEDAICRALQRNFKEAEKDLAVIGGGPYSPNSGAVPLLDGDIQTLTRYSFLLDILSRRRRPGPTLYFDPASQTWHLRSQLH